MLEYGECCTFFSLGENYFFIGICVKSYIELTTSLQLQEKTL